MLQLQKSYSAMHKFVACLLLPWPLFCSSFPHHHNFKNKTKFEMRNYVSLLKLGSNSHKKLLTCIKYEHVIFILFILECVLR